MFSPCYHTLILIYEIILIGSTFDLAASDLYDVLLCTGLSLSCFEGKGDDQDDFLQPYLHL